MTVYKTITRLSVAVVCVGVLSIAAFDATAQQTVDVSEQQRDLNDRGVTAIGDEDYDEAIDLLESSLELGELNVTYANLGRAYQRAGQCEEAEERYERALEAPQAESPPPEAVAEAIERYRREMVENCPGYLDVDCSPEEIDLFIDDEGPKNCHQQGRQMLPGNYLIRGEYRGNVTETTVGIQALQTSRVQLTLSDAQVEEPTHGAIGDIERPPEPTFGGPGWAWLAGSGAALTAGVLLDTIPESARNGEINTINFVPVGLYGASIGLGYIGIRNLRW